VKFELVQPYAAPVDRVIAAFADPAFYAAMAKLPKVGSPEVVRRDVDGHEVHLEVRMRFTGDLSAAARAGIDPAKLSWVEVSEHDLESGSVSFVLHPDHYADRFSCHGSYTLVDDGSGATVRAITGEVKVRVLLVRDQVERALVSGLREHFEREAPVVEAFAAGAG
jgi:hypothetical protein